MANMHRYSVLLTRVQQNAGPLANLRIEVTAPDGETAKRTAQAQYPGYQARSGATPMPGR
jgi:hypothetical protein